MVKSLAALLLFGSLCDFAGAQTSPNSVPEFLGHQLGESFQTFAASAVDGPSDRVATCAQSQTWAGKHRAAAGLVAGLLNSLTQSQLEQDIRGPKYTVPEADYSSKCASYLTLARDIHATGQIDCSASDICSGFTGGAAFENGKLELIIRILPQKWDEVLTNASQQLGTPTHNNLDGSLHMAGWKTDTYLIAMAEKVTTDLQRIVIVYYATYDRAFRDGVCGTCTPKK